MGVPGTSDIVRRFLWDFDGMSDIFCRDTVCRSEGCMTEMEAIKSDDRD